MRGPGTNPDKSPGTAHSSPDRSLVCLFSGDLSLCGEGPGTPGAQALMTGQCSLPTRTGSIQIL